MPERITRRVLLSLAAALAPCTAQRRKSKPQKPPQVEVLEVVAHRVSGGIVEIDGRVRNCGDKPIQNLVILFHIMAPGSQVITTQRGAIEEETLDPGEEAEFHWQMKDPARAVDFQIGATDRNSNELQVIKPGPYPIE